MKRLKKVAEDLEILEELNKNIEEYEKEVLNKFSKILEDNAELIDNLSMNSLHSEFEKDIDVLINENKENLSYTVNKLNQIKQKLSSKLMVNIGENGDEQF